MAEQNDLGRLEALEADAVEVEEPVLIVELGLALVGPLDGLLRGLLLALKDRERLAVSHGPALGFFPAAPQQQKSEEAHEGPSYRRNHSVQQGHIAEP